MRQISKAVFAILVPVSLVTCHHDNLQDVALVLPKEPNILWIVAEDLSPIIPPFGDETVKTPNLTKLAEEGVRFTNVFSTSGVCAPVGPPLQQVCTKIVLEHITCEPLVWWGRVRRE